VFELELPIAYQGEDFRTIKMCPYNFTDMPRPVFDSVMSELSKIEPLSEPKFHSPIEKKFWYAWHSEHGPFIPMEYQYAIDGSKYRVDFAIPQIKVAIELDGYQWHSSKEQFTKDRERQRELEMQGWRFVRFSGQEVFNNAKSCYEQSLEFVASLCGNLVDTRR
jgi:very-short-patch-repair endonuclease